MSGDAEMPDLPEWGEPLTSAYGPSRGPDSILRMEVRDRHPAPEGSGTMKMRAAATTSGRGRLSHDIKGIDRRGRSSGSKDYKLRGKDLACWCPLDQPCHSDVLLELANAPTSDCAPLPEDKQND